jgi:hypothetical protein
LLRRTTLRLDQLSRVRRSGALRLASLIKVIRKIPEFFQRRFFVVSQDAPNRCDPTISHIRDAT